MLTLYLFIEFKNINMKVTFKTGLCSVCFNNEQKRIDQKTLNSVVLTYFNILQTQVSRYKCTVKIWPIPQ